MAEEIRLVGNFTDNITPKLEQLNKKLKAVGKSFTRFTAQLAETNRQTGKVVGGSIKLKNTLAAQKPVIDANTGALKAYNRQLRNTARLERSVRGVRMSAPRPPKGLRAPRPPAVTQRGRTAIITASGGETRSRPSSQPLPGMMRGRGRGAVPITGGLAPSTESRRPDRGVTGFTPASRNKPTPVSVISNPASRAASSRRSRTSQSIGNGGLFGPILRAGIALDMIRFGARSVIDAFQGIAQQAREAELGLIQMANVIQTVGNVGDYGESADIASQMREDLARIAVELPGGTNDFITIQTRILDDMILSMGSIEAVQGDLNKGARSFVGLFGTFARLANLDPALAARDLDQLRRAPTNLRHIEILTRNAALMARYEQEIAKTPNDFMAALYRAMEKSATPQMIEAVKNSFDVALETIFDTLFNEVRGMFGTMRDTGFRLQGEFYDAGVSIVDSLGIATRQIGEVFRLFSQALGTGPIEAINSFIFEVALLFYVMRLRAAQASNDLGLAFKQMIRDLSANITQFVADLDYKQFFHYVDELVAAIFEGIGLGLKRASQTEEGSNALGSTVSGTALALFTLTGAANQLGFSFDMLKNGLKTITKGPQGSVPRHFGGPNFGGPKDAIGGIKATRNFTSGIKAVSKPLLFLGGAIETVTDLMEGKSAQEAIASGLGNIGGTMLGAGVGTMIFPGVGTILGAIIGGAIGGSDEVSQPLSATLTEVMGAFDGLLMSLYAIIAPFNELSSVIPGMSGDFNILSGILSAVLSPFALLEIGLYGLAAMINWAIEQVSWGDAKENARQRRIEAEQKMQSANDRFTISRRRDMGGYSLSTQLAEEDKKLADAVAENNKEAIARIKAYRAEIINMMPAADRPNEPQGPAPRQQNGPQNDIAPIDPASFNAVPAVPSASDMMSNNRSQKLATDFTNAYMAPSAMATGVVPSSSSSQAVQVTNNVSPSITIEGGSAMDGEQMAEVVADVIVRKIEDSTYREVFTS